MKATKLIIFALALALAIYFHDSILMLGLKVRLSFTLSKILPYAIEFFFVCLIVFNLYMRILSERALWMRRSVSLVVLIAGCGIAFAAHPIYEGDFNNTYQVVTLSGESGDVFQDGLTMVVLPNCPYCHARLEEMKFVSEIYPELPMYVFVVNNDTLALEDYRKNSNEKIQVEFFPSHLLMNRALNTGQYPTLFYKSSSSENELLRWFNDNFGYSAWDYVLDKK